MKRLTALGILLVIFAVIIIYVSSLNFKANIPNSTVVELSLNANNIAFAEFNVTNSSLFGFVYYTGGAGIDYLLLNQSAYSKVYHYSNSTTRLYDAANSLLGQGVIFATYNSPVGTISEINATNGTGITTITLPKGLYYNVFINPTASNTLIYYSTILQPQTSVSKDILSTASFGIIGIILFVGGVAAFLYSILFAKKKEEQQIKDEEISKMYERYEKPTRKKRNGSKRKKM